ncbi:MAG: MaoC family dehydratase N-terminal domain-containing protein [Bifidobacteriaceae bacterium]|nr:MaoC family dehydratase N-terminal domain-containing protein [Bifidobacteriaceae bacterium]
MGPDPAYAGRVYPPGQPYQVAREKLREFAAATGQSHPACFDPAAARALGHPDVVAAPTFAAVIAQRAEAAYLADPAAGVDFSRVVHAEESIHLNRPITAGDELTPTLRVVAIRQRSGIATVTTQVRLDDAVRQPAARVTSTLAITKGGPGTAPEVVRRQADATGQTGDAELGGATTVPSGGAVRAVRLGDVLEAVEFALTRADLVRYAGASGDFNPIHWSDEAASGAGLPGVVAHGMLTMGHGVRAVVDWIGDPGAVQDYAVRFARPVPVPPQGEARLRVTGRVAKVEDGLATVNLAVELNGMRVLGKAQAKVRLPA